MKTIIGYFSDILPQNVGCLHAIYPDRSVYENFNREGLTLKEYAFSVDKNKRHRKQALMAINDIEEIAMTILALLESKHVTS